MRELPITLALSLLAHAAALTAYVATVDPEPTRTVAKTTPTVELLPSARVVEEPPVEVALLPDDTVTQFPDATPIVVATANAKKTRPEAPDVAIVTTTQSTTELPATTEPPKTEEKKKSILSMRDGRPEPKIHKPGSDEISDEALEAMVNGTLPVTISNLPGARESADFEKANARLRNPKWVTNATGEEVTAMRAERIAARQAKESVELKAQKDGTHTSEKTTFKATVNRDGTVDFKDKRNWQQKSWYRAEFDVTDAFMRNQGDDPYASAKREYLDRTRDQRVEIGKRYRAEQLGQSAKLMASNLARLWAMISDPAKRKEELLALWDECAETGDEVLVEGGAAARRLVINWIHAKHVVFTQAELTAFNARKKSKATFAP
jgi:hypothetical protein